MGRIRGRHYNEQEHLRVGLRIERREMPPLVFRDHDALAAICRRYHIRRRCLARPRKNWRQRRGFARGVPAEARPSLLTKARIEIAPSSLLHGRKVDLHTAQDLSQYFRDEVVRTAEDAI
jgi:uncharacterized protein